MDDEWVSALTAAQKEALLVRALFELRKSRDRRNQSPRNSSKPPSSRAPWETTPADETGDEPSSAHDLAETPSAGAGADTARASPAMPGKTQQKPAGGKGAPKKKAGKQVGAQGFGRTEKLAVAEQALRHWVIARGISIGTRSESGTHAFALLASVIETCRKRSASSWTFIASVIAAARKGLVIPSLPAIPAGV